MQDGVLLGLDSQHHALLLGLNMGIRLGGYRLVSLNVLG
jgi:hypothetical protein